MEFLIEHRFLVIWFGAFLVHFFGAYHESFYAPNKKYNRSQFYIRKMFPAWRDKHYYRLDLIITPILGTLLALITINPIDLSSAFFSGLIWHYTFMSSIPEIKK